MKDEIIAYLSGPRSYRDGVALYERYGVNLMLKATFRRNAETELLRATLMEELRRLSGISESAFKLMPRKAIVESIPTHEVIQPNPPMPENIPVTPVVENMIRFRDRFPFLNTPECPDILKILVADMFTAYDLYVKSFKELTGLPDDAELEHSFSIVKTAVENYLEDRSIWEELEYYRDNGDFLGKHPRIAEYIESRELSDLSDLELVNVKKNTSSNVSKWKKKAEEATEAEEREKALASLDKWTAKKNAAEAELENRKKN